MLTGYGNWPSGYPERQRQQPVRYRPHVPESLNGRSGRRADATYQRVSLAERNGHAAGSQSRMSPVQQAWHEAARER